MISEKLQKALNDQITGELWSANLYMSMSFYLKLEGYDGFANWMRKQATEETDHAYAMADFIIKRGGTASVSNVESVPGGWGSPLEVFEHVYSHECHISEMINNLLDIAIEEKDKAAQDFLWSFVREQVEEEATASNIVERIKKMGDTAICYLDGQLGQRQK